MSSKSPIVPILAGAGGALVAVVGADKLGVNPGVAAWGTAAAGAATALGTTGIVRDVATGVGAAGMCLGALQLFASAKAEAAKKAAVVHKSSKRQADGDFITREQLNDALAHMADQQQKGHCDLLSALDDIRKIVANAEQQQGRTQPTPIASPPMPRPGVDGDGSGRPVLGPPQRPSGVMPILHREAGGDYERNAYAEEERNAYAEEERNAFVDEYSRNAYGDEERNAYGDEERNAFGDEERNADEYERNADLEAA